MDGRRSNRDVEQGIAPVVLGSMVGPSSTSTSTSAYPGATPAAGAATAAAAPAHHAHPTPPPIESPPMPSLAHRRTAPPTGTAIAVPHTRTVPSADARSEDGSQSSSATLSNNHNHPAAGAGTALPARLELDKEKDTNMGAAGAAAKADADANSDPDRLSDLPPSPTTSLSLSPAHANAHSISGRHTHIQRTATGTRISRPSHTSGGDEAVAGYGMVLVRRQTSLPPGVGPFGGAAPSGEDAERGLRAVRSHEEEIERQEKREREGADEDPWAVRFEPGDKANPKNWGVNYRWGLTGLAGLLVLNSTFASSAPSGIITDLRAEFGLSQELAVLTISLFVAGYCVGPLVWGPLSETAYGRRPIFLLTFAVYTGFQVGCALSPNTGAILVFRFLGGTFAAAPLTNSGALLADIWDGDHRGQAMSIFALAPFAGPSLGPIVSGFISVAGVDWRWVFWILTIFAGVCFFVILFFVPETYAPALLLAKAKRLRKETGDDRWYAPIERADSSWRQRINDILLKPFIMLALEPMLLAVTLYMSFVYGLVYLLEAFPFVFVINHGFSSGENGLAFLAFFMGGCICVLVFMLYVEPRYQRHAAAVAPAAPSPEKRLELCVVTAWCLVVAMFWFGWTSYPSIHWISPVLAAVLLGIGVLGMFVTLFNYIIDVYLWSAASALAASTVVRSAFGAGFPLFAGQMYERLGTQWASSLLGFLALVMAPIPLVLMRYGPYLRTKSRYSPNRPT